MDTKKYTVLIIGLGNLIMSDDGVGIHLIRELKKRNNLLRKDIFFLEVGTAPLNYLDEISNTETLIVIDAVKGGKKAGNIYCFKEEELAINTNSSSDFHGYSILEVIGLARELTYLPVEVIIYGVEPENIGPGEGLSLSIQDAVLSFIKIIIKDLIDLLAD